MTNERFDQISQMLEAWKETDAHESDAEKSSVIAELLAELALPLSQKR